MVASAQDGVSSFWRPSPARDGPWHKTISPQADRYLKLRELERDSLPKTPAAARRLPGAAQPRLAVVGQGRLGNALSRALRSAGSAVEGPLGRGSDGSDADAVLLCVPDAEIAAAAALIQPGRLVGHCSGATGLEPLALHEAFSLHPLMTVTDRGASFDGAGAAVDGSSPRALELADQLANALGMRPVRIGTEDRAAYHAAASIASNFLVALEASAERLAATVGVDRELLVPLVRATVENWAELGPDGALTGPVARGDDATVQAQRTAVAERAPELVELFDALVRTTRALASRKSMEPQPA
jgi:predicted short-subunit dehydrogenase-like oxidoreductase (DUF2520 family)